MRILDPHQAIDPAWHGSVVAIGNFDGVHIGHQMLLELARQRALHLAIPFIVLTFDPHPRRFFRPDTPPFLVTPNRLKFERLQAAMVDAVLPLSFNHQLSQLSPKDFIDQIIKQKLHASEIFVGADFHFGHDRAGTPETFRNHGIPTTTIDLMTDQSGNPYSSTRIRASLQEGHIDDANRLLGWNWELYGQVIEGDQRGRELGFPTANIKLGDVLSPAHGIYAAHVQTPGEHSWRMAAMSLGHRPMFAVHDVLLEVHILDFQGDLYGQILRIRPVRKLRDEIRFDGLPALIAQMQQDCALTRQILQNHPLAV